MTIKNKLTGVLAITLLSATSIANAAIVYENGVDGNFSGGNNPFTYQEVYQQFNLTNNSTVNSLTYNAYTTGNTVPVTNVLVEVFEDNGGIIGNNLFSENLSVANQAVIGGDGYYSFTDYTVNFLQNLNLSAGSYFLGLLVSPNQWDQHWSIVNGGPIASDNFSHYFRLENNVSAVPVPAAIWLFGSALAGLGVFGKRRQTVQA